MKTKTSSYKVRCKWCSSGKVTKRGLYPKNRYQCHDCGKYFYDSDTLPSVLLFDIETMFMETASFSLFKPYMNRKNILKDWYMLGWSAKWLYEPKVYSSFLTSAETHTGDDSRIVSSLWNMIDKADVVIAHNGSGFDVPKFFTRAIINGMSPPSPFQIIDTLTAAKSSFAFSSNSLESIAISLGLEGKSKTDFDLWKDCSKGDPSALKYMKEYCENDSLVLENVYILLRPWIKSHPNLSMFVVTKNTSDPCPRCGEGPLKNAGKYKTNASVFQSFVCENCGAFGRTAKRVSTTNVRNV